jgi:hypothetical protein
MLPNFIIAGPPKSGTTSLQFYLDKHPDIYVTGEAHFFNKNYKKGLEWYESYFNKYQNEKAVGEKSPSYFFSKDVPSRIKKHIPDAKLLFIFRDPIKRAYSQYWHNVRHAREKAETFEIAVEKELKDLENDEYNYLKISNYIMHLKRWEKIFPKSKMFFLTLENMNKDVLCEILEFLNVDSNFDFGELKKFNIGGSVRSKSLAKFAQNKFIKKIPYLSEGIKRGLNMRRGKTPEIIPSTRRKLKSFFEPYNDELAEFTGLDLSAWNK